MRWVALVAFLGLSACTPVQHVPCPSLVAYTKEDQAALAAEIKAISKLETVNWVEIVRWLGDYIGLRDQVRACLK